MVRIWRDWVIWGLPERRPNWVGWLTRLLESRFLSRSCVLLGILNRIGAELSQGRSRIFQELHSLTGSNGGTDRPPARTNRDQLLPIFWRQRWVVVLTTVFCLGAAVAYLLLATPIYTSTAPMAVKPS